MSLPADLCKRGIMLLNQQCWVWGRDILRPEGNLLIEYGFKLTKPPRGESGSSQYVLSLACGATIRLWGFGIFYGRTRGIHLNRFEFQPWVVRITEDIWQADRLAKLSALRRYSALSPILLWIAAYESWVLNKCGPRYRNRCLVGWTKEKIKPQLIAEEWAGLAYELALLAGHNTRRPNCRNFDSQENPSRTSPESSKVIVVEEAKLRRLI